MSKLGKTFDHPHFVSEVQTTPENLTNAEHRYLLQFKINNQGKGNKTVTVILKNPSSASVEKADTTVNRVQNYIYRNLPEVSKVNILNLFSYRATYKDEIAKTVASNFEYAVGSHNDSVTIDALRSTDIIIAAWGGPSQINHLHYNKRIEEVLYQIENSEKPLYKVERPQKTFHPLHGQIWGYKYPLKTILINNNLNQAA